MRPAQKFIVCGMGGSALAADLLKILLTDVEIVVHRDYGLPFEASAKDGLAQILVIASSYSGNTEETLSSFKEAQTMGLPVAAVSTGGELLKLAKETGAPFIQIPDTGIQPRMATGYMAMALLKLMAEDIKIKEFAGFAGALNTEKAKADGENLAGKLSGKIPIIYSSNKNFPIAYNWKIKFNETAKIPAFTNVFPELNHNEMNGFMVKALSEKLHFIFLKDEADGPRIHKRMAVLEHMLKEKGFGADAVAIEGENDFHKIFQTLMVADWASYFLARHNKTDAEHVPMVEEFKRLIK